MSMGMATKLVAAGLGLVGCLQPWRPPRPLGLVSRHCAVAEAPIAEEAPLDALRAMAPEADAEAFAAAIGELSSAVDAVRALDIALEHPKSLSSAAFAATLECVARAKAPPEASGALVGHTMARLRKAEIEPDALILTQLGAALLRARKNKEALSAIDIIPVKKRSTAALRTAIVAAARLDDANRIRELTQAALKLGDRAGRLSPVKQQQHQEEKSSNGRNGEGIDGLDDATLKFAIKVLAKARDYRTPFAIVDALPAKRRSTPMYHAAITACGKAFPSKGKTAMLLWRRMKADGLNIPRATYNALLHAAQSSELGNATTAILAEMAQRNISLNVISYNIALNSLAGKGRFGEMLDLLDSMETMNIQPTAVTFGTAIHGAARANNSAAALELIKAQRRFGINPADAAFGAALEACLRDPDGATSAGHANTLLDIIAEDQIPLERRERIETLARTAVHRGKIDAERLKRDEEMLGMVLRNRQMEV